MLFVPTLIGVDYSRTTGPDGATLLDTSSTDENQIKHYTIVFNAFVFL